MYKINIKIDLHGGTGTTSYQLDINCNGSVWGSPNEVVVEYLSNVLSLTGSQKSK